MIIPEIAYTKNSDTEECIYNFVHVAPLLVRTHTVITIKCKERNYINFRVGKYRKGGRESTWERVEDKIERKNYYYSIPIKTYLKT